MRFENIGEWPERAKRSEWAAFLDCHPLTLQKLEKTAGLPAERPNTRMTFYKRIDIIRHVMNPRLPRIVEKEKRIAKLRKRLAKLTGEV
jgi:hypothetical protein